MYVFTLITVKPIKIAYSSHINILSDSQKNIYKNNI